MKMARDVDASLLLREAKIHFRASYGCKHILAAAGTCIVPMAGGPASLALVLESHELTLACALQRSGIPLSKGTSELARQRMQWLAGVASGLAHLHCLGVR